MLAGVFVGFATKTHEAQALSDLLDVIHGPLSIEMVRVCPSQLLAMKASMVTLDKVLQRLDAGRPIREVLEEPVQVQGRPALVDPVELMRRHVGQCFLDVAEAIIDQSKRFHGNKDKVQLSGAGHIETIAWGDVDMDRDRFHMSMDSASSLPTQPAARLAALQEYAQAGFIDREKLMALMGMPDVSEEELLISAPYRAAYHVIDRLVLEGVYTAPNKYMKLDTCIQLGLRVHADMQTWDEVDDDRMALLEQFIDEAEALNAVVQGTAPGNDNSAGQALAPVQVTAQGAPVQAGAAPMAAA